MIMNAALLVERDKAGVFDRKVEEIGRRFRGKLSFRCSGPWPPYNFVTIRFYVHLQRPAGG
jgi:hypothetical protein